MSYYVALLIFFLLGYLVTEAIRRAYFKREIRVSVKHKDGTTTTEIISVGRDFELEKLIKEAQQEKESV